MAKLVALSVKIRRNSTHGESNYVKRSLSREQCVSRDDSVSHPSLLAASLQRIAGQFVVS